MFLGWSVKGEKSNGFKCSMIGKCCGPLCVWIVPLIVKNSLLSLPQNVETPIIFLVVLGKEFFSQVSPFIGESSHLISLELISLEFLPWESL